uniref:Amidase domain-containing protein n=1 Tax=Knipowitschia caucasica TaxID=637954 RepID=A0AAV2KTX0_KNICA
MSGHQEELLSTGPMCRYAELSLNKKVDLKKLRIFTLPSCGDALFTNSVSEDLKQAQRKTDLGVKVEEVHFPELKHSYDMWFVCMGLPDHSLSALKIKEKLQQDFEELLGTDGVFYSILNVLGLPVTQCPLGLNQDGLPLGVQVVAGKLQDHLTIATAQYLEKAFGGWRDPGAN